MLTALLVGGLELLAEVERVDAAVLGVAVGLELELLHGRSLGVAERVAAFEVAAERGPEVEACIFHAVVVGGEGELGVLGCEWLGVVGLFGVGGPGLGRRGVVGQRCDGGVRRLGVASTPCEQQRGHGDERRQESDGRELHVGYLRWSVLRRIHGRP